MSSSTQSSLTVEQFPGGHSNLTYLLRFGTQEFALRCPPFGPVPPKAHDMAREYRILEAVHTIYPFAPRPFVLCEDASVIGATFYIMERRRGVVVRYDEPPELADIPEARRRVSQALVDALATLHAVDIDAHGLNALGKPAGLFERKVRGWGERWKGSQTGDLPEMDTLAAWLAERLPPDAPRPTLVHGDFKLDNVMLDASDVGRVVAVFDWEMTAIGDPLVDVGILLCYWCTLHGDAARFLDVCDTTVGSRAEVSNATVRAIDLTGITFTRSSRFSNKHRATSRFLRYHRGTISALRRTRQASPHSTIGTARRIEWVAHDDEN